MIVLLFSLAAGARAADSLDVISLDSQVYQSDLVIEGRLVEPPASDQLANDGNVRITAVYRGNARVPGCHPCLAESVIS